MTPELLEHFLIVCKYMNISRAADALFLDNSSLGRQMNKLEDYYETQLLIRNNRSVELTPAGRELAEAAPELLKAFEGVRQRVQNAGRPDTSSLAIAALNVVYKPLFEVYEAFKRIRPNTALHLRNVAPGNVLECVLDDSADIGVESYTMVERYANYFDMLAIDRMNICVMVNENHRLSDRTTIRLDELADERFVVMGHKPQDKFLLALQDYEDIRQKLLTSPYVALSWQDMILQVLAGTGIALIPAMMARSYPGCIVLDIEDQLSEPAPSLVLFWKTGNKKPELKAFVDLAKSRLAK